MLNTAIPLEERPDENHLLACLPPAIQARWLPHLEWVDLELGQVLHEALAPLTHVYFPATAIVSLLYVMENGASAEIAVVGNDGMVGFALIMGGDTTPSRAVVQSAGTGLRMKAKFMKHEFNLVPSVCHRSAYRSQGVIGILEPADDRRNEARA